MNIKHEKVVNELLANGGSIANAMRKSGYSPRTARSPKKMTESKSYQEVISPVVLALETERNRVIKALSIKNLTQEKYRDMIDGLDKLTKNIQLLNGGKTSNDSLEISWLQ